MTQTSTTPAITSLLSRAGIRPSVQRVAVMRYVAESHSHPTADDIYRSLSPEMPSLSKTTVYNTLRTLIDARLINMVDAQTPDCMGHYDSALRDPHSHFVCRCCGRIIDIAMTPEATMPEGDFTVESSSTCYRGLCADCRTQASISL